MLKSVLSVFGMLLGVLLGVLKFSGRDGCVRCVRYVLEGVGG